MRRVFASSVALLVVAGASSLFLRASAVAVPSGVWAPTGDLSGIRAGAAAVLLSNGVVLVTGGSGSDGRVATAERYSVAGGTFVATASMGTPRANHTATALNDGRVLVVGGFGAEGAATASVELYDPSTNAWTPAGSLTHARAGHSATLLPDGRVLVAGGENGDGALASMEIYSPVFEGFALVATPMTSARARHAAALAGDKVLITGGWDGAAALASVDVFDPEIDSVAAGPSMLSARAEHTATTLLNGDVLVAGGMAAGGELQSAEVFDAVAGAFVPTAGAMASARRNHLAILLPHNNSVLIAGGSSGGAASATAELYRAWQDGGIFVSTSSSLAARNWSAGSALSFAASATNRGGPADGLVLVAGGEGASSAELYGFATVKTDKDDYQPGDVVYVSGSGWLANQPVTFYVRELPAEHYARLVTIDADAAGNISGAKLFDVEEHHLGVRFLLTAADGVSQAHMTFTDGAVNIKTVGAPVAATITWSRHSNLTCAAAPIASGTISAGLTGNGTSVPGGTITNQSLRLTAGAVSGHSFQNWTGGVPSSPNSANPICVSDQINTRNIDVNYTAIDTTAPIVTLTTPANGSTTNDSTPEFRGVGGIATGDNATVTVKVYSGSTAAGTPLQTLATTRHGTTGNYSVDSTVLVDGTYTAQAEQSDTASHTGFSSANTFTVDTGVPQVLSIAAAGSSPTNASNVQWTVTFSENVTGVDAGDFALVNSGLTSPAISTVSGSGSVYTVTASTGSGSGTLGLNLNDNDSIVDLGGNKLSGNGTGTVGSGGAGNGSIPGSVYAIDRTAPTVISVVRADVNPTNASTVQWTVTFSENVTGVTSPPFAFSLALSGLTSPGLAIQSITGSGTTYTVTVGTGRGTGSLGLNVDDNDTISDALGNKLGGTGIGNGAFTGEVYSVDRTLIPTITAANKPYDGTTTATILTRGFTSALTVTEDVNVTGGTATFADINVGIGKTVTANGLELTGTDAAKYVLSSTSAQTSANIDSANVTGSFTAANKTYDGNTSATILTRAITGGVVGTDVVTLEGGTASFNTAAVGSGKPVTGTGFTLGGANAGNYQLGTVATTTANIEALNLTITGAVANNKPYDGTTAATVNFTSASLTGVLGADQVTIDTTSYGASFADKNVGTGKPVTVTGVTLGGTDAGNYTVTQPTGLTANIEAVNLTITGAVANNKTYDGNTAATVNFTSASLTGVLGTDQVTIDATSYGASFADKNVGTGKPVTVTGVTLGGIDAGNYTVTQPTGLTANIEARPLAIAATGINKVYDGTTVATVNLSDNRVNGDILTTSYTTAAFSDKNVGIGKGISVVGIAIIGADAGNYTHNTTAVATANITERSLTVGATGIDKVYDGTTAASVTLSDNRISGDILLLAYSNAAFVDPNPGTNKTVNVTGITVTGSDAGNYTWNTSAVTTANITYGTCVTGSGGVILPPINSDGTSVYQRKGGSTIPVKFRVCDAFGNSISNPTAVFAGTTGALTMLSAVRGTIGSENEPAMNDVPDAAFRWDPSGQQWIFNMATTNLQAATTYALRINLAYGVIQFKVGVK